MPLYAPPPLPPGRQRLSAEEVAHNHRERILVAVARVLEEKGQNASTIADITAAAGLDRRAFYRIFRDKDEACKALNDLALQHVMTTCARAFFSAETWPERIWASVRALAQLFDDDRTLAGFMEAEAGGPGALQRVDEVTTGYIIFLQEGFQYSTRPDPPSQVALEAITAINWEISHNRIRTESPLHLSTLVPHDVFNSLAPFLGPAAANEFIDKKLAEASGS
jgi:AcrR family transcriptional regulator